MTAMAFLREHNNIDEMGDATSEPEPKTTDPIANLIAQDQVAFIRRMRPASRILLLFEDFREPGSKVLVLLHVANRQLTHMPPACPMGDSHPFVSNSNATPEVPVCERRHRS